MNYVAQHQRRRLLRATLEVVAEYRYAEISVQMIIAAAGVSRVTFYNRFRNKRQAFLEAVTWAVDRLRTELVEGEHWLDTLVDQVHSEPGAAASLLVELPAVDPDLYESYMQEAVRALDLDPIIGRMVVGGIAGILAEAVRHDRSVDLEGLRAFVEPYLDASARPVGA